MPHSERTLVGRADLHAPDENTLEEEDFMGEAHVHGFANRMGRDVVVVDVRSPLLGIHHYQPGYAPQRQISMRTACNLRHFALAEPMWFLMEPGHWSALLPTASETSGRAAVCEGEERKGEGA